MLSMNLATLRSAPGLTEAVEACVKGGITSISPWRDQIDGIGLDAAKKLFGDNGLRITGLCRGGMFTAASAKERRRSIEDNLRAIDEAATLGADCLVLVVGGLPPGSRDLGVARRMVADGLAEVLPRARAAGVPLAIEPLHPMYAPDRAVVNTLDQALDLCDSLGAGIGVVIDAYHVWWDPGLAAAIARAGRGRRILAHHISDFLVPTTDLLLDRGMMGDGVIDLRSIREMIEAAGYDGPQEVEIFSRDTWWKKPADEVVRIALERFNAVCIPAGRSAAAAIG